MAPARWHAAAARSAAAEPAASTSAQLPAPLPETRSAMGRREGQWEGDGLVACLGRCAHCFSSFPQNLSLLPACTVSDSLQCRPLYFYTYNDLHVSLRRPGGPSFLAALAVLTRASCLVQPITALTAPLPSPKRSAAGATRRALPAVPATRAAARPAPPSALLARTPSRRPFRAATPKHSASGRLVARRAVASRPPTPRALVLWSPTPAPPTQTP